MEDRIYSFLGLATKAGKLIAGDETCERAIKMRKVFLVIVSEDASDNTKKRFADMCSYRNVPLKYFGEKEQLGFHTGKSVRAVIAVTEKGFAEHLKEMIDGSRKEHGGV